MLLTCPSCESEYTIDAGRVGAGGRTVRCAACRTTWFVTAGTEPAATEPQGVPVATPGGAEPAEPWAADATPDGGPRHAGEPLAIAAEAETARTVADAQPSEPETPASLGRKIGPPRPAKAKPVSTLSSHAGVAFALVATLAVGLTAIVARAGIVRLWPDTAGLYAAAGWPVNLRGLALNGIRSELQRSERETILVVEGEVANPTDRDIDVPRLALEVRGVGGDALYAWTNEPPRGTLGPGETARFRARLASPPADGRQVLVRFAAAGDGRPVAAMGQ